MGLQADKIFVLHQTDEVSKLDLPAWLPLSDAQSMLLERVQVAVFLVGPSIICTEIQLDV